MRKTVVKKLTVLATVASMLSAGMVVAHADVKVMENGTFFDAEYYAQTNADVVAVYGTKESSLFRHFEDFGRKENRQAVELPDKSVFDPEYYAALYADVVEVYGINSNNLYQHYLQYGKNEGRVASASATGAPEVTEAPEVVETPEATVTPEATETTETTETPVTTAEGYYVAGEEAYQAQDYAKAFECYSKAAEAGHAEAMRRLGVLYQYGYGVERDNVEAMYWYMKAAESGCIAGYNNTAYFFYAVGDYENAAILYEKGASLGDVSSMINLAVQYYNGEGVMQDTEKAIAWLEKAVALGDATAMNNLGVIKINNGDYEGGVELLEKAAALGNESAKESLQLLQQ